MNTGESLYYDFKHGKCAECVFLFEDINMVLSGGSDHKLVLYNFKTSKVLKILDLGLDKFEINHLNAVSYTHLTLPTICSV